MSHSFYLRQALAQAIKAQSEGQNPIGCVVVDEGGAIIAQAHNEVSKRNDRTAHAEMLAIQKAIRAAGNDGARGWTLYTTIEPCIMCLSTIVMSHIGTVVWGAEDRHIQAHKLLAATAYMRTRRLVTIACPDADIERECERIHSEYWTSMGRPDALRPTEGED